MSWKKGFLSGFCFVQNAVNPLFTNYTHPHHVPHAEHVESCQSDKMTKRSRDHLSFSTSALESSYCDTVLSSIYPIHRPASEVNWSGTVAPVVTCHCYPVVQQLTIFDIPGFILYFMCMSHAWHIRNYSYMHGTCMTGHSLKGMDHLTYIPPNLPYFKTTEHKRSSASKGSRTNTTSPSPSSTLSPCTLAISPSKHVTLYAEGTKQLKLQQDAKKSQQYIRKHTRSFARASFLCSTHDDGEVGQRTNV